MRCSFRAASADCCAASRAGARFIAPARAKCRLRRAAAGGVPAWLGARRTAGRGRQVRSTPRMAGLRNREVSPLAFEARAAESSTRSWRSTMRGRTTRCGASRIRPAAIRRSPRARRVPRRSAACWRCAASPRWRRVRERLRLGRDLARPRDRQRRRDRSALLCRSRDDTAVNTPVFRGAASRDRRRATAAASAARGRCCCSSR